MQSLLRWGIENSGQEGPAGPPVQRKDLDSGIIDMILGKPDAQLMKEDMEVALNADKPEDERIDALDHLELLIEHIDNANDLDKLKMWPSLQSLLTSENSTDDIKMQALWVIGTALQNNPSAQQAYFKHEPLHTLTSFLVPSAVSPQVRSKALYALSGLLKHNAPAVKALDNPEIDGWTKLRDALQDHDITVRRKAAFLINSLLMPAGDSLNSSDGDNIHGGGNQPVHENSHAANLLDPSRTETSPHAVKALLDRNILPVVVEGLTNPLSYGEDGEIEEADVDLEEKLVGIVNTYTVNCNQSFADGDRQKLKTWLKKRKPRSGENIWGLSISELECLEKRLI